MFRQLVNERRRNIATRRRNAEGRRTMMSRGLELGSAAVTGFVFAKNPNLARLGGKLETQPVVGGGLLVWHMFFGGPDWAGDVGAGVIGPWLYQQGANMANRTGGGEGFVFEQG